MHGGVEFLLAMCLTLAYYGVEQTSRKTQQGMLSRKRNEAPMTKQAPQGLSESEIEKFYVRVNEGAWSRIKLDPWSQLKWFVDFAETTSFTTMPEEEQRHWKEELGAMLSKASRPFIEIPQRLMRSRGASRSTAQQTALEFVPALSPSNIQQIQDAITAHLTGLADGQGTFIGSFSISYSVMFRHQHELYGKTTVPRYLIEQGEVGGQPKDRLLLYLAQLLEHYADHIRRCKHGDCRKLFLQGNRNAKYCGPKCYTIGCMRELRARRKREAEDKKRRKRRSRRRM